MKKLLVSILLLPLAVFGQPSSGVTQIKAGDNITITPTSGKGIVTINASVSGGSGNVTNNATLTAGNIVIGGGTTVVGTTNISVSGGNNIGNVGTLNATTVNATNVTLATPATNGQILIGSTATGNLTANVITPGTGIGITNGATSITISVTNVPNASLANSTITIGGTSTALGGTATTKPVFDNVAITTSTLTYSTTPAVDFSGDGFKIITLTGDATFSGSNYAAGKSVTVVIVGDSSTRNLAFDSDWVFLGAAAPTTLAANKKAVLTLTSTTGADTGIIAAYAAQP